MSDLGAVQVSEHYSSSSDSEKSSDEEGGRSRKRKSKRGSKKMPAPTAAEALSAGRPLSTGRFADIPEDEELPEEEEEEEEEDWEAEEAAAAEADRKALPPPMQAAAVLPAAIAIRELVDGLVEYIMRKRRELLETARERLPWAPGDVMQEEIRSATAAETDGAGEAAAAAAARQDNASSILASYADSIISKQEETGSFANDFGGEGGSNHSRERTIAVAAATESMTASLREVVTVQHLVSREVEASLFNVLSVRQAIATFLTLLVDPVVVRELQRKIQLLRSYPQSYFGIPERLHQADGWAAAVHELREMDTAVSPSEKLAAILASARAIYAAYARNEALLRRTSVRTGIRGGMAFGRGGGGGGMPGVKPSFSLASKMVAENTSASTAAAASHSEESAAAGAGEHAEETATVTGAEDAAAGAAGSPSEEGLKDAEEKEGKLRRSSSCSTADSLTDVPYAEDSSSTPASPAAAPAPATTSPAAVSPIQAAEGASDSAVSGANGPPAAAGAAGTAPLPASTSSSQQGIAGARETVTSTGIPTASVLSTLPASATALGARVSLRLSMTTAVAATAAGASTKDADEALAAAAAAAIAAANTNPVPAVTPAPSAEGDSTKPAAEGSAAAAAATASAPVSTASIAASLNLSPDMVKALSSDVDPLGADDFFPIHVYVVVRANLQNPLALKELLWATGDPTDLRGQAGYYLTVFEAAIEYIKSLKI